MIYTGEAPEQRTIQSERMQRRCANTPPTSFNTSHGSWQPCSPSSLRCSEELLQEVFLHEQDPGLPRLKDRELTGNQPPTLLSLCRSAARLVRNTKWGYALHRVSESLGSAFALTTDQPPKFENKIWSMKGQIKPFTSWVCIKWGKQSVLQPWGTSLPRNVFETFLSWRNYGVQLSSCKYHRRLERTNICIRFIPCCTTNFMCDLSNSSASPGSHFPIHF